MVMLSHTMILSCVFLLISGITCYSSAAHNFKKQQTSVVRNEKKERGVSPKYGQMSFKTKLWLRKNKQVFSNLFYNEGELAEFKEEIQSVSTATINYDNIKVFWSKLDPSSSCTWLMRRWQRLTLRSTCGSCCTTEFLAVAPITVNYNNTDYYVYHPTRGWQILFLGGCPDGESCSTGICEEDDVYHTWILIMDDDIDHDPKLRFVPITYPRFCKCINSS